MTNENKIEICAKRINELAAEVEKLTAEKEKIEDDLRLARTANKVHRKENDALKAENNILRHQLVELKVKYEFGLEVVAEGFVEKDDSCRCVRTIVVKFNKAAMDWRKRIMDIDDSRIRSDKWKEFDRRTAEYLDCDVCKTYFDLKQTYDDIFTAVIVPVK